MTQIIKLPTTGDAFLNQLLLWHTPGSKKDAGETMYSLSRKIFAIAIGGLSEIPRRQNKQRQPFPI